jgi:hypothetical protein
VPLARAVYRTRQFRDALFPRLSDDTIGPARSLLRASELRLFEGMEEGDRSHGLRVMRALLEEGETDHDLLAAALLHDCGKGRVGVWLRVANVIAPWSLKLLAHRGSGASYRLVHHARLGAELARQAGSSEETVRLIAGVSAAAGGRDKISVLRAADDRS